MVNRSMDPITYRQFPLLPNDNPPTPANKNYLIACCQCGYGERDWLDRAIIADIKRRTGRNFPQWLMKDKARRLKRGAYFLPELLETSEVFQRLQTEYPNG